MTATTLDAYAGGRDNNFDVLRLLGALLVLVSHSFLVAGALEPTVGRWTLGTVGVSIFFSISGFLIAMSWMRRPSLPRFALRRVLRIMPALLVTVLVSAFLLGPTVTTWSPAAYFGGGAPPAYALDNVVSVASGGFAHSVALTLPGVYEAQPAHAVNLPLWTLPIEVRAYGMIAVLGLLGLLRASVALVGAAFFALSVAPHAVLDLPVLASPLDFLRGADGLAAHLTAMFFVSAALYRYRRRVPLRLDLGLVVLAALIAALGTPLERPALVLAIPYLVLCLAFLTGAAPRRLTRPGDVSYGIYLFAFPIQQTIVYSWGGSTVSPLVVVLLSLPASYLLALGSWHLIESRALAWRGRGGAAPAREPAPRRADRPEGVESRPPVVSQP